LTLLTLCPIFGAQREGFMDFLIPVLGTVTGIEAALWKDILLFTAKCALFVIPFVVIGLLIERDFNTVPVLNRLIKSIIVFAFFVPPFLFGILNYFAPDLPETFWESYPALENFWLMEGKMAPVVLSASVLLYFLLYLLENVRGDLTN
jgi:hypothetical protein